MTGLVGNVACFLIELTQFPIGTYIFVSSKTPRIHMPIRDQRRIESIYRNLFGFLVDMLTHRGK